ncbi:hypothetical protein [Peteryoungia ipomoeae]|uniref:Secreted protein n=1 Tax=Peteryoungia ipomoeae TaxID=1210932 RepID=A0A4S8PBL6_9HYPH|nr:hypothetical protein [Peteryoungia ipomoeae]THV25499.1 hypothetical protein FAA97_04720 [Peteryoungia ipomoeae]
MKMSLTMPQIRSVLLVATAAGLGTTPSWAEPRADVTRDVQGIAVATCLTRQSDPVLKEQGEGWLQMLSERAKAQPEDWKDLSDTIDAALAEAMVPVVMGDKPGEERPMPLILCAELTDDPIVARQVDLLIERLRPAYQAR